MSGKNEAERSGAESTEELSGVSSNTSLGYEATSMSNAFADNVELEIKSQSGPSANSAPAHKRGVSQRQGHDELLEIAERYGDTEAAAALHIGKSGSSDGTAKFPALMKKKAKRQEEEAAQTEGLYGKVPAAAFHQRRGKVLLDSDLSLFPFNYIAGKRSEHSISVNRDDRMSPIEAKNRLLQIFQSFGIQDEAHDYLYSFTHSLLVAHALNGASIVGPCRATFGVAGDEYMYGDVVKSLGPGMRRFFRAYADETAKALALVLSAYDPSDAASVNLCGQIRMLAVAKKLVQFPYLIHDSADACVRINNTEAAAVLHSKNHVLERKPNSIEGLEKAIDQ